MLLPQSSVASSVERHSSEESETIVCSLLASPSMRGCHLCQPCQV